MGKKTEKEGKQKMRKQKSWNQGGKNRKQKLSAGEERLEHLLDQAEEEELMKISAIHSEVSMPLPNREKLAWSVIDKADLADEEELKRREEFRRALRRKKMIRIAIGCSVVVVLLLVLAWFGVFDRFNPPAYEDYYVLGGNCYSKGESLDPMEVFREKALPDDAEVGIPSLASSPYLDQDKLNTTAYHVLAEYCEANDYAVDEYKIAAYVLRDGGVEELEKETKPEYRMIDGKLYLRCTVLGTCLDYGREDNGETWYDYESNRIEPWESHGCIINSPSAFEFQTNVGMEWIPTLQRPLDNSQPTNVCSICLTLYVCIQD